MTHLLSQPFEVCRVFFRRGQRGQFAPADNDIAPAGIDIASLKGPLILIYTL